MDFLGRCDVLLRNLKDATSTLVSDPQNLGCLIKAGNGHEHLGDVLGELGTEVSDASFVEVDTFRMRDHFRSARSWADEFGGWGLF